MLKYQNHAIVFREIPDEISLAINIAGCPIHCPDCHSKELWENKGTDLSAYEVIRLIKDNPGITCVLFMGGDSEVFSINILSFVIKQTFPLLKTAWYSGKERLENLEYLDYIKIGPYIKDKGPLDNPNTNQRLYKMNYGKIVEDITYKFWNNGT